MNILFKAVAVGDANNWVEGYYHYDAAIKKHFICTTEKLTRIEVIPYTVCQSLIYNKTRYWEGDYDEDGNMLYFCEQCCGWQFAQIDIPTKGIIHCSNCEGNFMLHDYLSEFVPIGNIHDPK